MKPFVVSNQGWLKATVSMGVVGFAIAAVAAVWSGISDPRDGLAGLTMIALGAAFGTGSAFGCRLVPHLSHLLHATADGMHIEHLGMKTFLPWESATFRVFNALQVIEVLDASGNRVYSVDFYARHALDLLTVVDGLRAED